MSWFKDFMSRVWSGLKRGVSASFSWARDTWSGLPDRPRKITLWVLGGLALLYFPLGMAITHTIDDALEYQPSAVSSLPGGSKAVVMTAGLIDREVSGNGWVANDPFFKPSSMLDNMPNYQQGIMGALARFAIELRDQIGRTRGSSSTDEDLNEAAGLLPYPGDVWIFNFKTSLLPTASSERQYLRAREALLAYNARLSNGEAVFDRRADNLLATLDRIALDIGASSAAIDDHIRQNASAFLDFGADDLFYTVKGQTYAYYMVLRALRDDFQNIINAREIGGAYAQMLDSFAALAALDPWVVANNDLDGQFMPNHLAAQGFYLLRARTQLREITQILTN